MQIADIGTAAAHQAPTPGGPTLRPLLGQRDGAPVAVVHVTVPAGGGMAEHDHGPSHVVLVPLSGSVRLRHSENDYELGQGTATHIGIGERVSLTNPGPEPATLLVVAAPPDFAAALTSTWLIAQPDHARPDDPHWKG